MVPIRSKRNLMSVVTVAIAAAGSMLFLSGRLGSGGGSLLFAAIAALPVLVVLIVKPKRTGTLFLLLALLSILIGRFGPDRNAVRFEEDRAERLEKADTLTEEAVVAAVDSILAAVESIVVDPDLERLLAPARGRRSRGALFSFLEERGGAISGRNGFGEMAFELFREGEAEPLAWWGRIPALGERDRRSSIRMETGSYRIHLVVDSPIHFQGRRTPRGFVRAIFPVGIHPDLHGKSEWDLPPFAVGLRDRIGGTVLFYSSVERGDRRIRGPGGTEVGSFDVVLPDRSELARVGEERAVTTAGFFLLLFWTVLLARRRAAPDGGQAGVRGFVRRLSISSVLIVRALLILFDYPARFGVASLTGGDCIESPLLLGAMKSPADLLLTAIALLLVLLVLRERIAAGEENAPASDSARPAPLALLLLVLSAATVGFGVWMREILVVAGIPLFDTPNPIAPVPVLIIEMSILLIASAYLLLVDAGFVRAARYGAPGPASAGRLGFATRVFLAGLFAASILLLSRYELQGGAWRLLAPAVTVCTGLLLLYLLRGRGWRIWNGFGFVIAVALVSYPHLSTVREETRLFQMEENARRFAQASDETKRIVLDETLDFFEGDSLLVRKLAADPMPPMSREAFLAWARSGLSSHDFSVEIQILDRQGAVVSRFARDMPAESPVRAAFLFRDVRAVREKKIDRERRRLGGEPVEIYTGAVPLLREDELLGAVVVSIPYFYEDLARVVRPPASSYDVFRDRRKDGPARAPVPESLQVLLYRDGEAVRSSNDLFPDEARLGESLVGRIETGGVARRRIHFDRRPYDAFFTGWNDPERTGLLAFATPVRGWFDHTLSLIDVVLTDLFLALVVLLILLPVLIPLSIRAGASRFEPTFQDKLVLAFLLVALLPAILLGGAGRRMVAKQLRETGETEARAALEAVRYGLDRDGILEAEKLAQSTQVRRRVLGIAGDDDLVDLELSLKRFAIFSPDGVLILQNGKVGAVGSDILDEVREKRTPVTAFQLADGLSHVALVGITLEGLEEKLEGILLLSRPIDEEWTVRLGERFGSEISFYEEGRIHSATRFDLYQSGIMPPRLPAKVFTSLELKGEEVRFDEERAAGAPYRVGYRVLRDFDGTPVGSMAVPLLFRERDARRDLDRAYAAITYLTFFVLVVIVFVAEGMGQRIARPIAELSRGMKRVTSGELDLTLPVRSGGEIGRLVRAFNRMTGELRRRGEALTERTRYIETVLGSVGAGVIAFDRAGVVTSANQAASKILEIPLGELRRSLLQEVSGGRLAPLHRFASGLDPASDQVHEGEEDLPRGDGRVTLRVVATAIADAEGRDLGRVIVFEDLTDLIRSKKLLAWGEMARQVAHEIKNPLTPIKLEVQHLRQAYHDGHEKFPELLDESAELIIEEIDKLQWIATEFSTFARMPRREIRRVPASAVIGEAVRLYGEGIRGTRIETDLPGDLPDLLVDKEEVRRLLINLLENAVQAIGAGGTIRVSAAVEEGSPRNDEGWKLWEATGDRTGSGPMLVIRVADDGPGVTGAAHGKLFEPNFSTKTDGTGLGLAICRAIIDDYGGVIAIGSTAGKGTVAIVSIPLDPE